MIDIQSGTVSFEDGLELSHATTRVQLEGNSVASAIAPAGRTQLSVGTHNAGQRHWGVGVVFVGERLAQVWLQCLDADRVDPSAWDIGNEMARKTFHDQFLRRVCAGHRFEESAAAAEWRFPWGKVSSVIDLRGVQALIIVEHL